MHWGWGLPLVRPPSNPGSLGLKSLSREGYQHELGRSSFWQCLSVCVSVPVSGLLSSVSFCLCLPISLSLFLPTLGPDGTQEVSQGSRTSSLAAPALVRRRPHPPHICRHPCGRSSAGRIALPAGCRRNCTSGLREEACAWIWLGTAFLGTRCP